MSRLVDDLGRRIAEARGRAGLTQQQCADAIGIDRTSLAMVENDERQANASELAELGIALDVRVDWFLEDPPPAIITHWNNSDSGEPSPAIDRKLERVAREVEFLEELYGEALLSPLPSFDMPQTPEEMENCALEVRKLLGYKPLEPTTGLLEHTPDIGILPFTFPLGTDSADGGSLLLSSGAVAVINGSKQYSRRRLTLTYAIGHCVFGDEYSVDWQVASVHPESHESQIDRFAIALLLPADSLKASWIEASPDDSLRKAAIITANKFQVGMSALARRLHQLELIDGEQADEVSSYQTTRADVFHLKLVVPPDFSESDQTTVPRSYTQAVLDAYRKDDISAARAVEFLFYTWDEAELPELPMLSKEALWELVCQ